MRLLPSTLACFDGTSQLVSNGLHTKLFPVFPLDDLLVYDFDGLCEILIRQRSMTTSMIGNIPNVDGRGCLGLRCMARTSRGLLRGSVVEIDNQMPRIYYSIQEMRIGVPHRELKWEIPV
jgi:hypothetical protein